MAEVAWAVVEGAALATVRGLGCFLAQAPGAHAARLRPALAWLLRLGLERGRSPPPVADGPAPLASSFLLPALLAGCEADPAAGPRLLTEEAEGPGIATALAAIIIRCGAEAQAGGKSGPTSRPDTAVVREAVLLVLHALWPPPPPAGHSPAARRACAALAAAIPAAVSWAQAAELGASAEEAQDAAGATGCLCALLLQHLPAAPAAGEGAWDPAARELAVALAAALAAGARGKAPRSQMSPSGGLQAWTWRAREAVRAKQ